MKANEYNGTLSYIIYNFIDAKQMSNKYVHTANKHNINNQDTLKTNKTKYKMRKFLKVVDCMVTIIYINRVVTVKTVTGD